MDIRDREALLREIDYHIQCSDEGLCRIPRQFMLRIKNLLATEPAAYQQLKNGKWVECSEFVAKGWSDKISEGCRALYTLETRHGDL